MTEKLLMRFPFADKREISETIRYFMEYATKEDIDELLSYSNKLRNKAYGERVFFRGLIEFSSFCKNNCYYCGIRRGNKNAVRYRMSLNEIQELCDIGYKAGFRTFVLQSGEDSYYTDEILCSLVYEIKSRCPDCAVTLSIGELNYLSYKKLFEAGANRYLLRHETASEKHYGMLHPPELRLSNRKRCLYNLKEIGYQVGAGFMVDSPYQTYDTLAEDFLFLRELLPHMVGIGPFIPHKDTRFAYLYEPSIERSVILLSLVRIMLPNALIPATTAFGTIDALGREKGLMAGANVVMPNLTLKKYRDNYNLYDNKLCNGLEGAENLSSLMQSISDMNMIPDLSRGDHVDFKKDEK